jgi:hypothetical protein
MSGDRAASDVLWLKPESKLPRSGQTTDPGDDAAGPLDMVTAEIYPKFPNRARSNASIEATLCAKDSEIFRGRSRTKREGFISKRARAC